jgi:hypothetical protein
LAQAFQALVPDEAQREQVLNMAERELAQTPMGKQAEFPELWKSGMVESTTSAEVSPIVATRLSASARSCPWVRGTRFGPPVDPAEYWNTASSSGSAAPIAAEGGPWSGASTSTPAAPAVMISTSSAHPDTMRRQTAARSTSAMTARTPHSRKQKLSSACLNCGLSGTAIAPSPVTARKLVTNAGASRMTSPTGSPGSMPRSDSPRARRPARSARSP